MLVCKLTNTHTLPFFGTSAGVGGVVEGGLALSPSLAGHRLTGSQLCLTVFAYGLQTELQSQVDKKENHNGKTTRVINLYMKYFYN